MRRVARAWTALYVSLTNVDTKLVIPWAIEIDQCILERSRKVIEVKNIRFNEETS